MISRKIINKIFDGYLDKALSPDSNYIYIVGIGLAMWSQRPLFGEMFHLILWSSLMSDHRV